MRRRLLVSARARRTAVRGKRKTEWSSEKEKTNKKGKNWKKKKKK